MTTGRENYTRAIEFTGPAYIPCMLGVDLFGRFNGGYIGSTSHSTMPETPLDNVIALYEAFLEYQPA